MRELWNHPINHGRTFPSWNYRNRFGGGGGRGSLGAHTVGRSSHVSEQIAGSDTSTCIRLGGVELPDIRCDIWSAVWSRAARALSTPTLISAWGREGRVQQPNTPIWQKGGREEWLGFTCSFLNRKWPLCPKAFVLYFTQHLTFQKSMSPRYGTEALTTAFNREEHDIMPCSNGTQETCAPTRERDHTHTPLSVQLVKICQSAVARQLGNMTTEHKLANDVM